MSDSLLRLVCVLAALDGAHATPAEHERRRIERCLPILGHQSE